MIKKILFISVLSLPLVYQVSYAKASSRMTIFKGNITVNDTIPQPRVMDVVKAAIYAVNNFNVQAVASLYTPNAVIADDEPPYSWNGPTAGVQWVEAVEKAVKDNRITKFKGEMESVKVYQQTADDVYVVVPVTYTGNFPGSAHFTSRGAFTFVLRQINSKWLIKSQVWMPGKGLSY